MLQNCMLQCTCWIFGVYLRTRLASPLGRLNQEFFMRKVEIKEPQHVFFFITPQMTPHNKLLTLYSLVQHEISARNDILSGDLYMTLNIHFFK